ncbi:MAG: FprA family A-type flavoprotein [Firmicutes bacterium]|nr:FprA family A-type flavoprotein [Bacillota bacterium]
MVFMKPIEMKPNVYWVGGIDWDLRYFHGYVTPRGSTYNSYLIIDDKITLVDTVKHYLADEMLERISTLVDPEKIDYMLVNHVEMDHSGSVPRVMEAAPRATIVTTSKAKRALEMHYKKDWEYMIVKTGDELKIGSRTLKFVETPMVHWPDNMVTYIPEERLLLSNDAFGQHIASTERFVDELGWDIVREEAASYYANIVFPYGAQVMKALDVVDTLPLDMIAPSHGLIWRSYLPELLKEYRKWAGNETDRKALVVYDTMWGSTRKMALALREGLETSGVPVTMKSLQTSHISEIVPHLLTAKLVLVGSPTINNGMLPTMAAFLTYIKGLRPKKRTGFAFGSYGWGGQGAREVASVLKDMGWEMPEETVNLQYVPGKEDLAGLKEIGTRLAKAI